MGDEDEYFNFNNMSGFFRRHNNNVLSTYSVETIRNFKNLNTDVDRIRFIYGLDITRSLRIDPAPYSKNPAKALLCKNQGNEEFRFKNYKSAITSYSLGMQHAPQVTAQDKELFAILVSNRSAAYFYYNDHKNAIEDISFCLGISELPRKLRYKLWHRKAKSFIVLDKYYKAQHALKMARNYLSEMKGVPISVGEEIRKEIQLCDEKLEDTYTEYINDDPLFGYPDILNPHPHFPSATSSINQNKARGKGRYMYAAQNIAAGEFLVVEEANAAVLIPEYCNLNCSYCFLSINRFLPCPFCINVVFCSEICMELALLGFHKYECEIQRNLWDSGASINCMLALRMITVHDLDYFRYIKARLARYDKFDARNEASGGSLSIEAEPVIEHESITPNVSVDYLTVYKLCHHSSSRLRAQYLGYTNMAVYLLRLLKTTKFFEKECRDELLTHEEAYIGSLILRNLQVLEFNAHEISELRPHPDFPDDLEKARNTYIGAGVYPTIAYFNHSCDPGVVRYNQGTKMVVRALRNHPQGTEICENYGPIFSQCPKEERQKIMRERYWFDCQCVACENDWPILDDIDPIRINFKCRATANCDGKIVVDQSQPIPFAKCSKCAIMSNVMPGLKTLSNTDNELHRADELLSRGEVEKALKIFLNIMITFNTLLVPPYRDYIFCAQKIRTCTCAMGNRMALTGSPGLKKN